MAERMRCVGVVVVAAASMTTVGLLNADEEHHWSYKGATGPSHWAAMEHDYAACGVGKTQSPIDIEDSVAKKSDLPPIAFDYKPSPLKIVDNGHTVQVIYAPGSTITVAGEQYELVQFHFHKPSEEKINGKPADMVVHLVHRDRDGKLAVVAVLLQAGAANQLIDTLWMNVPKEKEKETDVPGVQVNAAELLPADKVDYYTFAGSLTTPPYSEGVTWFVLKAHTTISKDEIASFGKLYPMNARPTQAVNGREIRATK